MNLHLQKKEKTKFALYKKNTHEVKQRLAKLPSQTKAKMQEFHFLPLLHLKLHLVNKIDAEDAGVLTTFQTTK